MNSGKGMYLFRISLWQTIVINIVLLGCLLLGSKIWRDSLDRKDHQLQLLRNGHYVGTVVVDEVLLKPESDPEVPKPLQGFIEFSIQSDFDVLGHYVGPGQLWVQGKLYPLKVTYLHVHQHAEDGAFTATIAITTPRLNMAQNIDFEGKLAPPSLTFESAGGLFTHAALHKGSEADFDQLVHGDAAKRLPEPKEERDKK